jgi:hypothetical protein
MRKLQVLFRFLRLSWRRRTRRRPKAYPIPSVDPEEFSNLLGSGRKADLETLAKRLSGASGGPRNGNGNQGKEKLTTARDQVDDRRSATFSSDRRPSEVKRDP